MNPDTIEDLRRLCARFGYHALSGFVGVSPATIRFAIMSGALPARAVPRERIVRFVEANRAVTNRADLRPAA